MAGPRRSAWWEVGALVGLAVAAITALESQQGIALRGAKVVDSPPRNQAAVGGASCDPSHKVSSLASGAYGSSSTLASPTIPARFRLVSGALPWAFEPNQGQVDSRVKFLSRGWRAAAFLTEAEIVLTLLIPDGLGFQPSAKGIFPSSTLDGSPLRLRPPSWEQPKHPATTVALVRVKLIRGNPRARIEGFGELGGSHNYLLGSNPQRWVKHVPRFGGVRYMQVYPGVDLVFYSNHGELEFDFVVAPGASVNDIRLGFEGVDVLTIDAAGDVLIGIGSGSLRLKKPFIYQKTAACRLKVGGEYVLLGHREVGFEVAPYDPGRALVIDPVLDYSTYLGSSGYDYTRAVAVDSSGNAYVAGFTYGSDFPVTGALQPANRGKPDVFISKLSPDGSRLLYATYLGGSGEDVGTGLAVDSSGSAYVTGFTSSPDFPTANPVQAGVHGAYDAFVAKLDPSGAALLYSTYLGSSGEDYGFGIGVDSSGQAYLTGVTFGTDFPALGPVQPSSGGPPDAFLAKLDAAGSTLAYATYFGGRKEDYGQGVAVDVAGSAYLVGYTNSTDFPLLNPLQGRLGGGFDAFVAKLDALGSGLMFSTYLGGSSGDLGYGTATDNIGRSYVAGYTVSSDFPVTAGAAQQRSGGSYDAFAARFNPAGTTLEYSTYFGGTGPEVAYAVAADTAGNACLTGYVYGSGLPTKDPIQADSGGFYDAFVAKLSAAGSALTFSTYLGGTGNEEGRSVAVDGRQNIYVAGGTFSSGFPTTAGAFQASYAGGAFDAFVSRIDGGQSRAVTLSTTELDFGQQPVGSIGTSQNVTLTNTGAAPLTTVGIEADADFMQTNTCGRKLESGASCTIAVKFAPSAQGPRSGAVSITDDAPGSPHRVALVGIGTAAFNLSSNPSIVSVLRGTPTTSVVVTASSEVGYVGVIELTCIDSGPVGCTFTPDAVTPGTSSVLTLTNLSSLDPDAFSFLTMGRSGSQSATVVQTILLADFHLSVSPPSAQILAGGSATLALTVTPVSGFEKAVSLACSDAPPEATCSVSPASLRLDGLNQATSTVTIQTTAGAQQWRGVRFPRACWPTSGMLGQLICLWALFLMAVLAWVMRRNRGSREEYQGALLTVFLLVVLLAVACGGGSSHGPRSLSPPRHGTPAGDYTLVLSGRVESLVHKVAVSLRVQ